MFNRTLHLVLSFIPDNLNNAFYLHQCLMLLWPNNFIWNIQYVHWLAVGLFYLENELHQIIWFLKSLARLKVIHNLFFWKPLEFFKSRSGDATHFDGKENTKS